MYNNLKEFKFGIQRLKGMCHSLRINILKNKSQ